MKAQFQSWTIQNWKSALPRLALALGAIFALSPWSNSAMALFAGVAAAVLVGNPIKATTSRLSQKLLMYSVVGLGAGMNLTAVAAAGLHGLGYTAVSISLTLALGWFLGRVLKSESEINWLISFGTAICGGSAIAALAPVIRAKAHSITVALGVVFLLNSIALLVFPPLGHWLNFSETQFGLWSALAIHDTSSVVGAGLQYGAQALQIGTTVKLARALWIVPVVFGIGLFLSRSRDGAATGPVKKPWFILGFLGFAAVFTFVPELQDAGRSIEAIARKGMVLTLFLIGSNLTVESLRQVGLRPLVQGILLWLIVASSTVVLIGQSIIG